MANMCSNNIVFQGEIDGLLAVQSILFTASEQANGTIPLACENISDYIHGLCFNSVVGDISEGVHCETKSSPKAALEMCLCLAKKFDVKFMLQYECLSSYAYGYYVFDGKILKQKSTTKEQIKKALELDEASKLNIYEFLDQCMDDIKFQILYAVEIPTGVTLLVDKDSLIDVSYKWYEWNPVKGDREKDYESCEESEADFYSVYGRSKEGLAICVADCKSKQQAIAFSDWCNDILAQHKEINAGFLDTEPDFNSDEEVIKIENEQLSKFSTEELKDELEKRGYVLGSIWSIEDAKRHLEEYNDTNETQYELSDSDLLNVVKFAVTGDGTMIYLNYDISYRIHELINDKYQLDNEDNIIKFIIGWESGRGERFVSASERTNEQGTSIRESALEFDTAEEAQEYLDKYCSKHCYIIKLNNFKA